mmetsp:Transcript_262/g.577  ORF Transcript_262/g.577 Transcript_262/m.577 type:complete len:85 (-) Transcript_262:52-306(-)
MLAMFCKAAAVARPAIPPPTITTCSNPSDSDAVEERRLQAFAFDPTPGVIIFEKALEREMCDNNTASMTLTVILTRRPVDILSR